MFACAAAPRGYVLVVKERLASAARPGRLAVLCPDCRRRPVLWCRHLHPQRKAAPGVYVDRGVAAEVHALVMAGVTVFGSCQGDGTPAAPKRVTVHTADLDTAVDVLPGWHPTVEREPVGTVTLCPADPYRAAVSSYRSRRAW